MCDFIALTQCCKLIKFFTFNICYFFTKFNKAYRMPNILRSRDYDMPLFGKIFTAPARLSKDEAMYQI